MPMMDVATVCNEFEATLNRVVEGEERILLTREGKPVAALVPLQDWHKIEPDPVWHERFEQFLKEIQSRVPTEISAEEIDAEITAASEEARQERLASRH